MLRVYGREIFPAERTVSSSVRVTYLLYEWRKNINSESPRRGKEIDKNANIFHGAKTSFFTSPRANSEKCDRRRVKKKRQKSKRR